MGVKLDKSLFMGMIFCKTPSIRVQLGLKQLGIVFNNYSNPLRLRFPCFVNIYQGEVPQYGVCLPCGPINMGKVLKFLMSLKVGRFQNP